MNTAALPQIDYRVQTECNRDFVWSAPDLEWLMRELVRKGYRATLVMENSEYEREQQDNQRELVFEFNNVVEKESKTA